MAEIFEETFRLYRQHFPLMVGVMAVFQIPIVLLSVPFQVWQVEWSRRYGPGFPFDPGDPEAVLPLPSIQEIVLVALAGWAFVLVAFVLGTFGGAAMSYIVGRVRNGDPPPAREVFLALRRLAGSILGYVALLVVGGFLLLVGLAIAFAVLVAAFVFLGMGGNGGAGGLILLSLAGVVAMVILLIALGIRLSLAVQALVLERQRPVDALRRSWDLVRGSTWRTFGILFLATLVVGVLSGLVSVIFLPGVMEGLMSGALASILLVTLGSGLVQVLLGPIVPILLTVLYFDYARQATA